MAHGIVVLDRVGHVRRLYSGVDPRQLHPGTVPLVSQGSVVRNRLCGGGCRLWHLVPPQKIVLRKFHQGIDFVGSVIFLHHRVLRTKTKQRMFRKARKMVERFNTGAIDEFTLQQSMQSYLGLLQHCDGYKIEEWLLNEIWMAKKMLLW